MAESTPFETWAILELMGHRRLAGYVSEQTVAGHGFLRIDVPDAAGRIIGRRVVDNIYCSLLPRALQRDEEPF